LEKINLPPDEILFVDNDKNHLAAAVSTGIHPILYTDFARFQLLRQEAIKCGIK
jgi:FMN phosphatase YigB (HAD superfamily)